MTACACESTEQESARIARQEQAALTSTLKLGPLNREVHTSKVTLVRGGGRMAVAVRLTSSSTRAQANVPLLVSVTGAAGKVLYANATPGLEASLQHVPLLRPGETVWWVDDQVLTNQPVAAVGLQVGTGSSSPSGRAARLSVIAAHTTLQAGVSVLSARLLDRGAPAHSIAVVFAVALKRGRVVAAGRTTVPRGGSRAGTPFQIFLVGSAAGAKLELTVAPAGATPSGG